MISDSVPTKYKQILDKWIISCTRGGKVSRNTIAVGIVVINHLIVTCPVSKTDVVTQGGEIKGARSGLKNILITHGLPSDYLKEVTTRQGHQDGQRLLDEFQYGKELGKLDTYEREKVLRDLIDILVKYAFDWLKRQNLKVDFDRRQAPSTWIHAIIDNAKSRSGGVVEQHLVGAKLARRYKNYEISNFPAHAGDRQTSRAGDFEISKMVYHVTGTPTRNVIQKCVENIKMGLHPILLIPAEQEDRARILSQEENIDRELSIITLEAFIAVNIIELATDDNKDFYSILTEIVEIYNKRLAEVETDLSLQIQLS